jgi:hypothetical protein
MQGFFISLVSPFSMQGLFISPCIPLFDARLLYLPLYPAFRCKAFGKSTNGNFSCAQAHFAEACISLFMRSNLIGCLAIFGSA